MHHFNKVIADFNYINLFTLPPTHMLQLLNVLYLCVWKTTPENVKICIFASHK